MTAPARVVEAAVDAGGAGPVLAIADETTAVHLRWAGNGPTSAGQQHAHRLTVAAVDGGSLGTVSRHGEPTAEAIVATVRAARAAARAAGAVAAPDGPLDGPGDGPGGEPARWRQPAEAPSFSVFEAFLPRLGAALTRARSRDRVLAGYAEHRVRTTCVASSTGLRLRHVQPTGVLDLTVAVAGGRDATWAGSGVPDFAEVDPRDWVDRLEGQLPRSPWRRDLPAGRYELLLSPSAVADLMVHLYRAATAQDALDGGVFGCDGGRTRVGEHLSAAALTLYSDPAEPGLECAPFALARTSDGRTSVLDTGLALSRTDWLRDGVLTALAQTRSSARRTGLPCTPEIDNLVLTGRPGRPGLREMVATTRRALLVTSLWYLRDVDPARLVLTGVSRDGVRLVENGEIVASVPGFRFIDSPVSMLARVAEVGRTEPALPREWGDYFTRTAMPALRVGDVAVHPSDQLR